MTKAKILLILVIMSAVAIAGALLLGFSTRTETHIVDDCGLSMATEQCSMVRIGPNYLGMAYHYTFGLILFITLPWLLMHKFGRSTAGRLLVFTNLLLVLNLVIAFVEHDDYSFASYTLFTGPPFFLMLIISSIIYGVHRSRVRKGESQVDNGATIMLMTAWGGLVLAWSGLLYYILNILSP